jgi:SAM-dependent methyltransferase/GNAT superfamily N-acetyltransferase
MEPANQADDHDRPFDVGELYDHFIAADPAPVVEFLCWLTRHYGLVGSLSVLDVGCGTGRLLLPLAQLGWDVVGLEPRGEYLARAERAVSRLDGRVELRQGGFLDLADQGRFDVVFAGSDPFWYLLSDGERLEALRRVRGALNPDGIVFLDGPNFLWILKHYRSPEPATVSLPGLELHRQPSHAIDFHEAIWTHSDRFTITRGTNAEVVCDQHRFAMLSPPEVMTALGKAGFVRLETFSDYESRASEQVVGPRMMVAAQRAARTRSHDPRPLTVRAATRQDATTMGRVNVESWQHAFRGLVSAEFLSAMSVEDQADRFRRYLQPDSGIEVYVAELGGEVLGYVCLGRNRDPDAPPDTEELYAIYVLPNVWRTGVGRTIHDHALTRFRTRGAAYATLWVFNENTSARAFYESLGWELTGATHEVMVEGQPVASLEYQRSIH